MDVLSCYRLFVPLVLTFYISVNIKSIRTYEKHISRYTTKSNTPTQIDQWHPAYSVLVKYFGGNPLMTGVEIIEFWLYMWDTLVRLEWRPPPPPPMSREKHYLTLVHFYPIPVLRAGQIFWRKPINYQG